MPAAASHSPAAQTQVPAPFIAQHAQDQFRRLLEKLPAAACTCDRQGLITFYNPQAALVWGREPKIGDAGERFTGAFKLSDAATGQPIPRDQCWVALALKNNREYNGKEIILEHPDGRRVTVLAYANPIRNDAGELVGAVDVLIDITERKQAQDSLRQANRAKDEFLATLAHELRNPLAPIRNAVQILRMEQPAGEKARWALEVIERQMGQMTRLIEDLLDVSRITRNRFDLRKECIRLSDVVHVALETARPVIELAGHQLLITLAPQPLWLTADPTRLSQALANLLNNAAKYTERGGRIELSTSREGSDAVISIRDTGIGIAAEILPHIFDMFIQGQRALPLAQGGLGIGLTLVRRLVDLHGGSIQAKSDGPGKGSEFIIRLPLLLQPPLPATAPPSPSASHPHPSFRILVADDNHDSADSLSMLLRLTGNQVQTAYDGQQAVDLARFFLPDIVLLDIGMPNLNGHAAAKQLRQLPGGRDLILIALTGWGQESDRQLSKAAGIDHHLVKPLDPATLLSLLATFQPPRPS